MGTDWDTLPTEARTVVREVVSDLLHDWIKYMEMRLLSIDWTEPPLAASAVLEKAILQTRRHGDQSRSVRTIWEAQRTRLDQLAPSAPVTALRAGLEGDVAALEALLDTKDRPLDAEGVAAIIRRPGRRLRDVRDALREDLPIV